MVNTPLLLRYRKRRVDRNTYFTSAANNTLKAYKLNPNGQNTLKLNKQNIIPPVF